MPFKANLGGQEYIERSWGDETHPPVIISYQFLKDEGTYKTNTIVARNPERKIGRYDPAHVDAWRHEAFGVVTIMTHTDNELETVGNVMIHGAVQKEKLLVGKDEHAATDVDVDKLLEKHVYAI